jgi:hypothetical protein
MEMWSFNRAIFSTVLLVSLALGMPTVWEQVQKLDALDSIIDLDASPPPPPILSLPPPTSPTLHHHCGPACRELYWKLGMGRAFDMAIIPRRKIRSLASHLSAALRLLLRPTSSSNRTSVVVPPTRVRRSTYFLLDGPLFPFLERERFWDLETRQQIANTTSTPLDSNLTSVDDKVTRVRRFSPIPFFGPFLGFTLVDRLLDPPSEEKEIHLTDEQRAAIETIINRGHK